MRQRRDRPPEDVKVLYVMGLWRSGSTILDITLGNHERVQSVGELRNLPTAGWAGSRLCSCGRPVRSCPFWEDVRTEWMAQGGDPRRLAELQERFERLRSAPALLRTAASTTSDFRAYGDLVSALYRSIREVSGRDAVADSSKYPARAYALLVTPGIDLRLIHLVRDGRAVIWSCRRRPNTEIDGRSLPAPPATVAHRTAMSWLGVNLACSMVARLAGDRATRIRYEDFVASPAHELARIGVLTGLDTQRLAAAVAGGEALSVGHMVSGNRVRLNPSVRLRQDRAWEDALSLEDRRVFWRRAGWLARRYGYRAVAHGAPDRTTP